MDEKGLKKWAEKWIVDNLDPERHCYHHLAHAREVVSCSEMLARHAGVPEHDIALLRAAGGLHDTGYAFTEQGHEEQSIRIAREMLPQFGYTPEDVDRITSLIEATRFPHTVSDPLEALIADADLGVLGRADFPETSGCFRREMAAGGMHFTDLEFWRYERDFLRNFRYNSEAAHALLGEQLKRNLAWTEKRLVELEGKETPI